MDVKELYISGDIPALTETADIYTPPSGKTINIRSFFGSSTFNINCVAKLVWKYGTANEQIIWSISGENPMPFKYQISGVDVNGINSIAIVLDNGRTVPTNLCAFSEIEVF